MGAPTEKLCTISLIAARKTTGEAVREQVLVEPHANGLLEVKCSPGLVLGLVAGDLIKADPAAGTFSVVKHARNICVQMFAPVAFPADFDVFVADIRVSLSARLDAHEPRLAVFTIPLAIGFQSIERWFEEYCREHPDIEWYYGNVYKEDGVTPLNWWVSSSDRTGTAQ